MAKKEPKGLRGNNQERWEAQELGIYKINVNRAFKEKKIGVGIVIRDSTGEVIATMVKPT